MRSAVAPAGAIPARQRLRYAPSTRPLPFPAPSSAPMPPTTESSLSLLQLRDHHGATRVAVVLDAHRARLLDGPLTTYDLAIEAIRTHTPLADLLAARPQHEEVDLAQVIEEGRLLPPRTHPHPAHLLVTGTGLTHLGSADARDRMHTAQPAEMTDSMRRFQPGLRGGRPPAGEVGTTPEWFFKGTGASLVAPEAPLEMPDFSLDGGEEPEVAGLYVIGADGTPHRVGFALANEFSDHVLERQNYLLLAHSKLRPCSIGPELRLGPLPENVEGTCRILREDRVLWEKPFLTGEANMSHTLANLEHHHFKYDLFRQPGDVHVHTFGTATLSFADGIRCEPGDLIEISADAFHLPLRNPVRRAPPRGVVGVQAL